MVAAFLGTQYPFLKISFTPQAVASWTSLWAITGIPGEGANSSSGVAGDVPTDATAGAFPFTNSSTTYLARFSGYAATVGTIFLYDRLWHNSGINITTVGAQTINSTALTRPDANGASAEVWWQVYTTIGTGASLPTIDYTDQNGNASQTGTCTTYVASGTANRCFPFSLASGDTGVRSIQNYDNIGSHSSGTMGLIIRRYITQITTAENNLPESLDAISSGLPRIYDDACLELIFYTGAAALTCVSGNLALAQG